MFSSGEWVMKFNDLSRAADNETLVIYINRVIITYMIGTIMFSSSKA